MADLDAVGAGLEGLLSSTEAAAAAGLRFELSRARYVARRGVLRRLLAGYLGTAPELVPIERGPTGRPELLAAASAADLDFNVSSSDGLCLYALARGARVGADLERLRDGLDELAIARRAFGEAEAARLAGLSGAARKRSFFERWVATEARLKLSGEGLGALGAAGSSRPASTTTRVPAPAGYVAALATERPLLEGLDAPAFTGARPMPRLAGPAVVRLGGPAPAG